MSARLFLLLAIVAPAYAQETTATLLGTVTDSTGGTVPGVAIQAASNATNVTREAVTDASGAYSLPNLPPGVYRVTASKTGFQASRAENVTLQVEQVARLDIKLQV